MAKRAKKNTNSKKCKNFFSLCSRIGEAGQGRAGMARQNNKEKKMNAPDKIYLQLNGDGGEEYIENCATWAPERIYKSDIEYVKVDDRPCNMCIRKVDRDKLFAKRMHREMKGDPEVDHYTSERILCELLTELGYTKTVEAFEKESEEFRYS